MNWDLIGISIYVVGMIGVGVYFSRKIKTDDDYYLGGRQLGPTLATFSIFATWFGAETCIGTAGNVYKNGLSGIHADPIGYSLCLFLMAFFFAKVLWHQKITTIPDLLRERYSVSTEKLAAIILIPSSVIWAGAQVRALGQIIHATTDFGPMLAVSIAAGVVILYTMFGGMLADAWADLIQGIAIIVGLFILFAAIIFDMGGIGAAMKAVPLQKLTFEGGVFANLSFLGKLELWLVPILGSMMTQELVSRVVASKNPNVARNSAFRAAGIYFMVGCIPVLIGLLGVNYLPSLADPETLMPTLAKEHLNPVFYIIFVGALVSAILSTVDTTLMACSALISHNLIFSTFTGVREKQKVFIARMCTVGSGILSYVIAYSSDSISGLVETASSLGGPSILIITVAALWDKRGTAFNALFAMSMSLITWIIFHFVIESEYPVILTVLVCIGSYFGSLPFARFFGQKAEEEIEVKLG